MSEYDPAENGQGRGDASRSPRQRAIEAYENAGRRAADGLSEAPFIALAGGIAAGALIAALLPRTQAETRAVRPTARRLRALPAVLRLQAWRRHQRGGQLATA